jgi:hypothetical protein
MDYKNVKNWVVFMVYCKIDRFSVKTKTNYYIKNGFWSVSKIGNVSVL